MVPERHHWAPSTANDGYLFLTDTSAVRRVIERC
jgi:hypothetical protein